MNFNWCYKLWGYTNKEDYQLKRLVKKTIREWENFLKTHTDYKIGMRINIDVPDPSKCVIVYVGEVHQANSESLVGPYLGIKEKSFSNKSDHELIYDLDLNTRNGVQKLIEYMPHIDKGLVRHIKKQKLKSSPQLLKEMQFNRANISRLMIIPDPPPVPPRPKTIGYQPKTETNKPPPPMSVEDEDD